MQATQVFIKAAIILLVLSPARSFCLQQDIGIECGELSAGETRKHTQTYTLHKSQHKIAVEIEMHRLQEAKPTRCNVRWTVFSGNKELKELFHYSKQLEDEIAGVDAPSTSPDGTKLLVPLWTAEGDYTDHLPAVFDSKTHRSYVREIAERITKHLPSCDYSTIVGNLNNQGQVLLYVPKSQYGDEHFCPNQGKWLLNIKTDRIVRLKKRMG